MIINNLEELKKLLVFKQNNKNKPEIYYFVQVIQRKKDNPELEIQEIQRYAWWITSLRYLEKSWNRIQKMCEVYNARAYISITPRSLEKFGKQCMFEYSKRVANNDYSNIQHIPKRVALSNETLQSRGVINKPRWILDVDYESKEIAKEVSNFISNYTIVLSTIKTVTGYHIVIESFNFTKLDEFSKNIKRSEYIIPGTDIEFALKRDGNTILYANIK